MIFFSIITLSPPGSSNDARDFKYTGRSLDVQMAPPAFEWIVLGDLPPELHEEFEPLSPLILNEPFSTSAEALNRAIELASGEYIWFLPAGACVSDTFLMKDLKSEMIANGLPEFFYGASREEGHIRAAPSFSKFSNMMAAPVSAVLYRRRAIGEIRLDAAYTYEGLYDFTLRFIDRVTKIASTGRIISDTEIRKPSVDDLSAARAERFVIRGKLLRQLPLKNKIIDRVQEWTETLKLNYPKVFWKGRDLIAPVPQERPAPVVKGGYRGIFFKQRS